MAVRDYGVFNYTSASRAELVDLQSNKMKYYVNMDGETVGIIYRQRQPGEKKKKITQDPRMRYIRGILSKAWEKALQSRTAITPRVKGTRRELLVRGVTDSLISNAPDWRLKERLQAKRKEVEEFINEVFDGCAHNLHNREKRFNRKAMFNMTKYCYFITISYSDENFTDEEAFRKTLKKWFSNCHSNKGSLVQGVFERGGDNGRLHFHGLMYVPEGFFKDGLEERRVYSVKEQKWDLIHENPTLRRKFGQNDFCKINPFNIVERIKYITKYISKSGERFFYNRGIKGEVVSACDVSKINYTSDEYIRHYLFDPDVIAYKIEEGRKVDYYTDITYVFDDIPLRE